MDRAVLRTHQLLTEIVRHEHASLGVAQRCSKVAAPAPLFTSLFNYRHCADGDRSWEELSIGEGIEVIGLREGTSYPIGISVNDFGDWFELNAKVQRPADVHAVCELMHRALQELVGALGRSPGTSLRQLDMLPPT